MKGVGAMQEHLKIAYSRKALETFGAVEKRDIADVFQTDFTDVAAVVVTDEDGDALRNPRIHAFEIPVFLILSAAGKKHDEFHLLHPDKDFVRYRNARSAACPAVTRQKSADRHHIGPVHPEIRLSRPR